jgi:hypothetical protein
MSRLCVLICRVEDETHPDQVTPLRRIDLPAVDPATLHPQTALDDLETGTLQTGHAVMRHLLEEQWQAIDRTLVEEHQRLFPPGNRDL